MEVQQLFDAAAATLVAEGGGVQRDRIMHSIGVRTAAGKFFAFVRDGVLVAKLPAARVAELIAAREGGPFDAGKGRPMREWVCLAPADERQCAALMREARDFVGGLG